jgi:hypothetical protein
LKIWEFGNLKMGVIQWSFGGHWWSLVVDSVVIGGHWWLLVVIGGHSVVDSVVISGHSVVISCC